MSATMMTMALIRLTTIFSGRQGKRDECQQGWHSIGARSEVSTRSRSIL